MRQKLLIPLFLMLALSAQGLHAHPLGNFSINQFSQLEVGRTRIKVHQVLDMAEIPTLQESARIDADRDGEMSQTELDAYAAQLTPAYAAGMQLDVNGTAVTIRTISTTTTLGVGSGNMPILKIIWDMSADVPERASQVNFRNNNYPERVGWNEIVVRQADGVVIYNSSAFGSSASDQLRVYPQEAVAAPLGERAAQFSFTEGPLPQGARPLRDRDGQASAPVQQDRFAQLITVPEITPMVALIGFLAAFGLGALHAMSPGHGKTMVGAYLVGSRGTVWHAVLLGITVTITHTIGVFALGFLTLFASNLLLPETVLPFLGFVSGLLVFFIGISLFKERLYSAAGWNTSAEHSHPPSGENEEYTHTHGGSTHTHGAPPSLSVKGLISLGISGGLLPCPSALVLMLSAISLGRIGYGLVLTMVFSLGLASTLTFIGLAVLWVGNTMSGSRFAEKRLVKLLPAFSSLIVACVGAVICYNAIRGRL